MGRVGLWRHGHGVIGGHGEMDATGEGVLGFVFEVRVWTLETRKKGDGVRESQTELNENKPKMC